MKSKTHCYIRLSVYIMLLCGYTESVIIINVHTYAKKQKIESLSSFYFFFFYSLSPLVPFPHASYRARARFPHVARAQDRRPSWRSTNYITASSTDDKMQLYVQRMCVCTCICLSRAANTYRVLREVRGTESCEFGLWIAREWPRGSRHMLADEFSGPVVTSGDVGGSSAWFWVGDSIFGTILHNRLNLSSLKYRTWFCRNGT